MYSLCFLTLALHMNYMCHVYQIHSHIYILSKVIDKSFNLVNIPSVWANFIQVFACFQDLFYYFYSGYKVGFCITNRCIPLGHRRKLNVHKTFRRRSGRLLNVWCKFKLRFVSRGYLLNILIPIRFTIPSLKYTSVGLLQFFIWYIPFFGIFSEGKTHLSWNLQIILKVH